MFNIDISEIYDYWDNISDIPEIEAKIKNVNIGIVNSVRGMLAESYEGIQEESKDIFVDGDRYSIFDNGIFITSKTRIKDIFVDDVKLSISSEKNIELNAKGLYDATDRTTTFEKIENRERWEREAQKRLSNLKYSEDSRTKSRVSYILGSARVDTTIVTNVDGKKVGEIEIELLGDLSEDSWKNFQTVVNIIKEYVNMSQIIKDFNQWVTLDDEYMGTNYSYLTAKASTNPRNFKPGDFVWEGLLGGKVEYTITTKSDGIRRNMIIRSDGIWLVKPKRGFPVMERISEGNSEFHGTVIDGEWLETDRIFIPFDCISYKGSSAIQSRSHVYGEGATRMAAVGKVFSSISPCTIRYKNFHRLGKTRDSMIYALTSAENDGIEGNDGYIFTPNNFRYKVILSKDEKRWKDKRTLLDTPDILKLKPWDMLTIDFIVKASNGLPYAFDRKRGELTEFKGTKLTPFMPNNLIFDDMVFDKVVEVGPIEGTESNPIMKFTRIRDDKDTPNTIEVAESVWKDLYQPIFMDSLMGTDFKFLRLFFNVVKNRIMQHWKGAFVVDIGSGQGSDLNKWVKHGVEGILAIEPNDNNLSEFKNRYEKMKKNGSMEVWTLQSGGEETERIVKSFKDINPKGRMIISSMLSLSFFWSSKDMLKGLARTLLSLKKIHGGDGEFVFFTIERERTLNVFKGLGSKNISLGPATLKLSEGGIIDINFPNSIVGEQREYLVGLGMLAKMVGGILEVEDLEKSDYILSDDEKVFSSMYVTGRILF